LLLARECVAWGATREVLTPHNLSRARHLSEGWSDEGGDIQSESRARRAGAPSLRRAAGALPHPAFRIGERRIGRQER
jgi:zinc/manganese transport system ATP-binding protein